MTVKLKACQNTTPKPSYMQFPAWLMKEGSISSHYVPDQDTAREHYTRFFMVNNLVCQHQIAKDLVTRLSDLRSVYNEYDYSIEAKQFARTVILNCVNKWKEDFKEVLGDNKIPGLYVIPDIHEAEPILCDVGPGVMGMFGKSLEYDFIGDHHSTESLFNRYILSSILHEHSSKPKAN